MGYGLNETHLNIAYKMVGLTVFENVITLQTSATHTHSIIRHSIKRKCLKINFRNLDL